MNTKTSGDLPEEERSEANFPLEQGQLDGSIPPMACQGTVPDRRMGGTLTSSLAILDRIRRAWSGVRTLAGQPGNRRDH